MGSCTSIRPPRNSSTAAASGRSGFPCARSRAARRSRRSPSASGAAQEATGADFAAPRDPSVPLKVEATPLFDGASCVGTVLVVRSRRNGERHLDFEALAAGLAHEIKNPLAGLQGSAELLAREAEGAAREYALVIAREARRVDGLVRELLDLARPATLQSGPVNIHRSCGDVHADREGAPGRRPGRSSPSASTPRCRRSRATRRSSRRWC